MKLLFCFSVMLTTMITFGMGEKIKMPTKEVLEKRLYSFALEDFIKKTNIVNNLADKEYYPLGVLMNVLEAFTDYADRLKIETPENYKTTMENQTNIKSYLLDALLQDQPKALNTLKEQGAIHLNGVSKSKL